MNILQFNERYPDETSCIHYLKEQREREGVICKNCNSKDHYWLNSLNMFQCKHCKFRTGLKNGTIMENSKLPLRTWLLAMTLVSATKKGFSCLELQRQMGHSRYETVFRLYHKLREAMGKRDSQYKLEDMVEYDEAFVSKATKSSEKTKLKKGRGSQKQASVAVMAESSILEEKMLQNYLNEFCLKLNRRYFGKKLFDRLVIASICLYLYTIG